MIELADIFRRFGDDYLQQFGEAVLPSHRRALTDIRDCRTAALGGQIYACPQCGHHEYVYHSCRNRSCPKCHATDTEAWLANRRCELLPVPYFHLVFTIPEPLRELARRHQRIIYGLMMKAAAESVIQLAADPRYVGGQIGVLAVLHTWTRTLVYHPHVHCLIPGGGVDAQQMWREARPNFLVPVKALSKIFRAKFRDLLAAALSGSSVSPATWKCNWVVYCKPAICGEEKVLEYLGRYVHRVAITNSRLLSMDNGHVAFRYQNTGQSQWKTMALKAGEFIRRFLQHVLPAGVHKVRYFGLWHPANRRLLHRIQLALASDQALREVTTPQASQLSKPEVADAPSPDASHATPSPIPWPSWDGQRCPHCQAGFLAPVGRLPRQGRSPP